MSTGSGSTGAVAGEAAALVEAAADSSSGGVRQGSALYSYADIADMGVAMSDRWGDAEPGTVVAVGVDPGPGLLAAVFAAVSRGLSYLYIDPRWPRAYREDLLRWSGARFLVTGEGAGARGPVCEESDVWDPRSAPRVREDTVCVVTTSGTTGTPKLVGMSHRRLARLAQGAELIALESSDRLLALAHPGFGASLWETWAAIAARAELVFPTGRGHTLNELTGLVRDSSVNVAHLSAGVFRQLGSEHFAGLAPLRLLMTGGDTVPPAPLRAAADALEARVVACYGCTENTVFTSLHQASKDTSLDRPTPLGDPLPGTGMHVLDEDLRLVGPGEIGELYVTGDGVADGYLNAPEATAARFTDLPLGPGGAPVRGYRTGDLARRGDGDEYALCGRRDRQIQVRGFRVEPADVERRVRSLPGIEDAHVLQAPGDGEPEVVACVVGGSERVVEDTVLDGMRAIVPAHMVPDRVLVLRSLPVTERGKVDQDALERLVREHGDGPRADTDDDTTAQVLQLWTEILERRDLGIDDAFTDKGGHSLRATRLLSRISAEFGVDIGMRAFYREPTVRGTVRAITEARTRGRA